MTDKQDMFVADLSWGASRLTYEQLEAAVKVDGIVKVFDGLFYVEGGIDFFFSRG